jgi:hypothetical protein
LSSITKRLPISAATDDPTQGFRAIRIFEIGMLVEVLARTHPAWLWISGTAAHAPSPARIVRREITTRFCHVGQG